MINKLKFITTEPLQEDGSKAENLVWNQVQKAFAQRNCLAYWRYPIFSQVGEFRKEPDILILDFELGLIVIEVKSLFIEQIVVIQGHLWQYQNFYTNFGNPYQQAENQLFALLKYTNTEPILKDKITAKAIVALPFISRQQWQERAFDKLPINPPIIFKDHLNSLNSLLDFIKITVPVIQGKQINSEQWQLLLTIISGTPILRQPLKRVLSQNQQNRGLVLNKLRSHLREFNLQQEIIAKQIPPGMQRIRGIAGSGKTVILCQKAAHIHLKHPDWKIALVFFSRSLYAQIIEQVNQWLSYFSDNQITYNPNHSNLKIFHAWGSKKQPGFYSFMCKSIQVKPLTANQTESQQPNEALAEVCVKLLKENPIPQIFDAILIDEGQDLLSNKYKYEDKQPFYWLAYQALRPVDVINSEQKRLIWSYDEVQTLESLAIPTARELFGENLGHLVTGIHSGGINKSEILFCCYRTPHLILTAAHALGMGLLRHGGMLTGITHKQEWEAMGYQVEGNFIYGEKIKIKRPLQNSPNPVSQFWQGELIEFNIYPDRQTELSALATKIKHNLKYDGLRPCREILIIVLGKSFQAIQLQNYVANFLMQQGIDIYIPSSSNYNIIKTDKNYYNPNQFWHEGAVTISLIHRAKGQEADLIYLIGLDHIAQNESDIYLRNQLFIALTRANAWVNLSGIGMYPMYEEINRVLQSGDQFTFTYQRPPQREINVTDVGELLSKYKSGSRNFQNANLSKANLAGVNLSHANLSKADLAGANLNNATLDETKLIVADLRDANLTGASLKKAKLIGANLTNVNLTNADLRGADLTDVDLSTANLQGANLADFWLEN